MQFQYNSGSIQIEKIQYNTIRGCGKSEQFNTIWAPLYCIEIQFTLYWSTLPSTMATMFMPAAQGQRTHSARTKRMFCFIVNYYYLWKP